MAKRGSFSVSVKGLDEVIRRLDAIGDTANEEIGRAQYAHGLDVIAESVEKHVPVMDSELKNSNFVSLPEMTPKGPIVKIGFRAPYAAKIHENPRAGKTGGVSPSGRKYKKWAKVGHWKYLSIPFNAMAPKYKERIADIVRVAFARKLAGGS